MSSRRIVLLALGWTLTLNAWGHESSPAALEWLRQNAIPLNTVEAGNGFTDLAPLRELVGDARIVALGEATHGSREIFQLKHRLLEYLVTEMGFTVFAIEGAMHEARAVNEYVLSGTGDPALAIAGMYFWTWNTQEVLEMVRWMRRYNEDPAHARKVKFYGFDMQFPAKPAAAVLEYLRKVDPDHVPQVEPALSALANWQRGQTELPDAARQAEVLTALEQRFDERRSAYEQASSRAAFGLARQDLAVARQAAGDFAIGNDTAAVRDRGMAENVDRILEQEGPDARIVLWAHNGHVARVSFANFGPSMGSFLRKRHGDRLLVLGFAFAQGSFQAVHFVPAGETGRGLTEFTVGLAPEDSLDAQLARVGPPLFIADFRKLPKEGPVAEWGRKAHLSRGIGSMFSDDPQIDRQNMTGTIPSRHYDGIIFVKQTTRARPNTSGPGSAAAAARDAAQ